MEAGGAAMEGWDVVERAGELARRGEEFALATVVWRQGPSSGQQGSRAIVTASGQLYGWIGGACAEPVVIREAQRVIAEGQPRLLLLGTPEQFGAAVPDGMRVIPISCQSEGALEVYVEPVLPGAAPGGRRALADGAHARRPGRRRWAGAPTSSTGRTSPRRRWTPARSSWSPPRATATRRPSSRRWPASRPSSGWSRPAAAARRSWATSPTVACRTNLLDRVRVPVGLDLGHTSHREIAVAILAELVQLRAAGALVPDQSGEPAEQGERSSTASGQRPRQDRRSTRSAG